MGGILNPEQLPSPSDPAEPVVRGPRNYNESIQHLGEQSPSDSKPQPAAPTVPAGWYPDPENTTGYRYGGIPSMRYFDGVQWTEHRAPMQRTQQRHPYAQQPIFVQQNVVAPPVVVRGGNSSMAGIHLLLTIFTCGLWLPIWILIEIIQASNR